MKSIPKFIRKDPTFHRSQIMQLLQLATTLQKATSTGSSELADFANAADYEQTAKVGQH